MIQPSHFTDVYHHTSDTMSGNSTISSSWIIVDLYSSHSNRRITITMDHYRNIRIHQNSFEQQPILSLIKWWFHRVELFMEESSIDFSITESQKTFTNNVFHSHRGIFHLWTLSHCLKIIQFVYMIMMYHPSAKRQIRKLR